MDDRKAGPWLREQPHPIPLRGGRVCQRRHRSPELDCPDRSNPPGIREITSSARDQFPQRSASSDPSANRGGIIQRESPNRVRFHTTRVKTRIRLKRFECQLPLAADIVATAARPGADFMPPIAFSSSIASAMEMLGLRLRAVSTSSRPQSSSSARSCSSCAESSGESSGMLGFVPVCVMGHCFKRNAATPARNLRRGMPGVSAFALRRIQYFLENSISEDKNNYYGRVHCNDEPKQNTVSARSRSISSAASRNFFESVPALLPNKCKAS